MTQMGFYSFNEIFITGIFSNLSGVQDADYLTYS